LPYSNSPLNILRENYEGQVYCVKVPNSWVFVRRNGRISICGNTGKIHNINNELEYIGKELLDGFKIFDIERYDQKFPDAYTVDKAFLQSSKGIKKYFDITKPLSLDLQYSRWHIVAEK